MDRQINTVRKVQTVSDSAAGLNLVRDDFSIRIERNDDPRFWVRVECDMADGIVFTDYNAGTRPEEELSAGAAMAIRALTPSVLGKVIFRDLVPGQDDAEFKQKLVQAADRVKRICAEIAAITGQEVSAFKMEPRGRKVDAIVAFR